MNLEDLKKSDFLDQVKKVLSGEIKVCEAKDVVGSMGEVSSWLEEELGEKKDELFIMSAQRSKKDWPDQEADNIISFVQVVRQENRFKI